MYLYGDSTTFPLRENFLETLKATVRTSSALFSLECEITKSQAHTLDANSVAEVEVSNLLDLQNQIVQALKSAQGPASKQAAQILSQAAAKVLGQTRNQVTAKRDQAIANGSPRNLARQVRRTLASFFLTHQLPQTKWSFRWHMQDDTPKAEVRGKAAGFRTDFRCKLGTDDIWGAPILVASVVPKLNVSVPMWTRKCKGLDTQLEDLSEYHITEVDFSPSRKRMVLRRGGKVKHALMITLADASQSGPRIALADNRLEVLGQSHVIPASEEEALTKLWTLLLEHQNCLVKARDELRALSVGKRNLQSIEHPSEIAEELLQSVAPLAREIRLRSRVPGELILKRDLGEGRREEIFMPRGDIQEQYEKLPEHFRRVFDAMGMGSESTCDFVTMLSKEMTGSARIPSTRGQTEAIDSELDSVLLELTA